VIDYNRALDLATEVLGRPRDDDVRPWSLEEFSDGWLIRESSSSDRRGAAVRVIERTDGQIRRFPSAVPPTRILANYKSIRKRGFVDRPV
jgi:hypothetical protein